MADNTVLNSGSGGDTLASDDISGVKYPRSKLVHGADGTNDGDVSTANPLPVELTDNNQTAVADIAAIKTAVEIIDNAISGSEMQVDIVSGNVTNAGTFAVQVDGDALTALQLIDDAVYADDADWADGSSKHALVGGLYQSTPQTITDGDVGPFQVTANGYQIVSVNGTVTVDGSGVTQPVSGTVTANLSATDNTVLDNIQTSVDTVAAAVSTEMQVDVVASLPAGTNAIGKLAANSGVDIGDVDVTSIVPGTGATNIGKAVDDAAGATDTGIAMLAIRDDEKAALVADGDYVVPRTDRFGALRVTQLPDATSEIKYGVIDAAGSGDNTLQAAAGAGIKIRVLSAFLVAAGTVNARFESGAGGTALTGQMNLVANSGFTLPFNPAGWFETADNALLNLELSGAVSVDGCFSYVEV